MQAEKKRRQRSTVDLAPLETWNLCRIRLQEREATWSASGVRAATGRNFCRLESLPAGRESGYGPECFDSSHAHSRGS